MRKDAKAGMALALIIVVVAGWYYTRDDAKPDAIALAAQNEDVQSTEPAGDEAITAPARSAEGPRPVDPPAATVTLTAERSTPDAETVQPDGVGGDVEEAEDEALSAPGPAAARLATPSGALEPIEIYTIQPGDTLAGLAEIYYGDRALAGLIQRANPSVRDPDHLTPGDEIRLPAIPPEVSAPRATATAPAPAPEAVPSKPAATVVAARTYVARSGDSFYAIAKRVLGDGSRWPEVLELNKDLVDGDPMRLKPGMTLRLPPE